MLTSTIPMNAVRAPHTDEWGHQSFSTVSERHKKLAHYNRKRLSPSMPSRNWREKIERDLTMRVAETELLLWEIEQVQSLLPPENLSPTGFMEWFEDLEKTGPGQHDSLFHWLDTTANVDEMKWFIQQEVAGEAGFDDLTALTQIKLPTRAKLEVARNYWDEMGRGKAIGMHGPMLDDLAKEMNITKPEELSDEIVVESMALGNVLLGFALNRSFAYHSIGALGAVELTAPARATQVYKGLARLGLSPQGQRYFKLHSTVDIRHSEEWNKEVISPLITDQPELMAPIATGALVRLNAGARCFERYKKELGLTSQLVH